MSSDNPSPAVGGVVAQPPPADPAPPPGPPAGPAADYVVDSDGTLDLPGDAVRDEDADLDPTDSP